ncbi:DUF3885 domain-containing protein [Amycolatopsis sp. NPDC004772]
MSEDELSALWQQQWLEYPPFAGELKLAYRDRWARFHSLPESQNYPEAEYDIVLHRYNTVLDELFHDREVRIITTDWSDSSEPPTLSAQHARWNPDADHWASLLTDEDETDPDYIRYIHLYVSCRPWQPGLVNELLRAAAVYDTVGVMITSLALDRVHHPYDGGADIMLSTTAERDALKRRHADWLSDHTSGY